MTAIKHMQLTHRAARYITEYELRKALRTHAKSGAEVSAFYCRHGKFYVVSSDDVLWIVLQDEAESSFE